MNKSEDGNGPGQGMSAGYEITDGHCVSPPGNPTKGKDLEEDRRDEDGDHWQYIIWQRIDDRWVGGWVGVRASERASERVRSCENNRDGGN